MVYLAGIGEAYSGRRPEIAFPAVKEWIADKAVSILALLLSIAAFAVALKSADTSSDANKREAQREAKLDAASFTVVKGYQGLMYGPDGKCVATIPTLMTVTNIGFRKVTITGIEEEFENGNTLDLAFAGESQDPGDETYGATELPKALEPGDVLTLSVDVGALVRTGEKDAHAKYTRLAVRSSLTKPKRLDLPLPAEFNISGGDALRLCD